MLLAPAPPSVEASPVVAVAPGQAGELSLVIRERAERDLDLTVWLWSSEVELVENRLSWDHVVDQAADQPRLRVAFTAPSEPGTYAVDGHLSYVSCNPRACWTRQVDVTWSVQVTEPSG